MKLHAAINRVITESLATHSFQPLTWQASAIGEPASNPETGLFVWPGKVPVRTLTEESASFIARALGATVGLSTPVDLDYRERRGSVDEAIDVLACRAANMGVAASNEIWSFLAAARPVGTGDSCKPRRRAA